MSGGSFMPIGRRTFVIALTIVLLVIPGVTFAQSPWERAASNLEQTGPSGISVGHKRSG
jgi:hypothetical protein